MQIIAQCPECSNRLMLDDSAADRRITCPKCFMLFKIPKLQQVPKALEIVEKTNGHIYVDQSGQTYG